MGDAIHDHGRGQRGAEHSWAHWTNQRAHHSRHLSNLRYAGSDKMSVRYLSPDKGWGAEQLLGFELPEAHSHQQNFSIRTLRVGR